MPDRRAAFSASGGPVGALVLHGFTGSPRSMWPLAEAISGAGYAVDMPLLPGHGTTAADLSTKTYDDFRAAVEARYNTLARDCERVVAVGLSMGGTLALDLATTHPELAGVISINPFAEPASPSFPMLLRSGIASGTFSIPSIGSDVAKRDVVSSGYDETPLAPLASLVEAVIDLAPRLQSITCPVLLFSSVADHVVPPSNGNFLEEVLFGRIERVMLAQSFHVATLDYDAQEIQDKSLDFLEKVVVPL